MKKYTFLLALFLLSSSTVFAADWCERNSHGFCAHGWLWYDDTAEKKEQEISEGVLFGTSSDPVVRLKTFKSNYFRLKAHALTDPTRKNVLNFIRAQKVATSLSSKFSSIWMALYARHPELKDPTLPDGRSEHDKLASQKIFEKKVAAAKRYFADRHHSLAFFYRASCPHCKKMASKIKAFVQEMGANFVAISLDGKILPEFPESIIDQEIAAFEAKKLKLQSVPAVVVYEGNQNGVVLSTGEISRKGLVEQLYYLGWQK